jgi:hypothetical protein
MQKNLSRLTSELRKETCPPQVLDEVQRRIAAEKSAPARWRLAIPFAIAGLALLCGISVWRWQAVERARQEARLAEQAAQRAQIAQQAEDALGLMGSVLADAAANSGKIISQQAVPPLRNSFETAKTKLIREL